MKTAAPRKPKPRKPAPRKAAGPTLEQRLDAIKDAVHQLGAECGERFFCIEADFSKNMHDLMRRVDALETRSRYRDASHDAPVSNASEAVGQSAHVSHVLHTPEEIDAWFAAIDRERRPWWRRFLDRMGAP